jgi:mannose-1-phosphate guanylyltransferase
MKDSLWSVVLAAGMGRRLSTLTGGMPKQFWSPAGSRSLLDETLSRLAPLSSPARTLVVVDDAHRRYVSARPQYRERAQFLFQPMDRGTATGVLFGLVPVMAADPNATVVLTPADHGIGDPSTFVDGISQAVARVRSSGGIVLLGVEPSRASEDLGWITLSSESLPGSIRLVNGFVEKPRAAAARRLLEAGAVWNTMVLVAQVKDLVALLTAHLPEIATIVLRAAKIPAAERGAFFRGLYSALPSADFSRNVLAPARGLLAYTWPASMGWSDLGTPERLGAWLHATFDGRRGEAKAAFERPGRMKLAPYMQLPSVARQLE